MTAQFPRAAQGQPRQVTSVVAPAVQHAATLLPVSESLGEKRDPAIMTFAERRARFGEALRPVPVSARVKSQCDAAEPLQAATSVLPHSAVRSQPLVTRGPSPTRLCGLEQQGVLPVQQSRDSGVLVSASASGSPEMPKLQSTIVGAQAQLQPLSQQQPQSPLQKHLQMQPHTTLQLQSQLQSPMQKQLQTQVQLQAQAQLQPQAQPQSPLQKLLQPQSPLQKHLQSQPHLQMQPQLQPPGATVTTHCYTSSPGLRASQAPSLASPQMALLSASPVLQRLASPVLMPRQSPSLGPQLSQGASLSPHMSAQAAPVQAAPVRQRWSLTPASPELAAQSRSPNLVTLRRSVATASVIASSSSQVPAAGRPASSQGGSPVIALRVQSPPLYSSSPPLQKLTSPLRRASPLLQAAVAAGAAVPAASASGGGVAGDNLKELAEEDDLFELLPPPVLDLDADTDGLVVSGQDSKTSASATADPRQRWSSVQSEDGGSDQATDEDDLQQDADLVVTPRGTRRVHASKEVLLDGSFNIWFQASLHAKKRPKSEQQYEEGLQHVGTFNSVQEFWRYWNAIDLQKVPNFCSLSVFKHPIKPMWEDAHNKDGGQWVIRCSDRGQTADIFTKLALSLIGGYFECHDSLCGVVLSTKPKFNSLGLWNCQVDESLFAPVKHELRELLSLENNDSVHVEYKDHSGALQNNSSKRREVANGSASDARWAEQSSAVGASTSGSSTYGGYNAYSSYGGTYSGYGMSDGSGCGGFQYAMQENGQYASQTYTNSYVYYNSSDQYSSATGYYGQQELWAS